MRYFDCHAHLAAPDPAGFSKFLEFVGSRPDLVGCNLVLNTPVEVELVRARQRQLPPNVLVVPPLPLQCEVPAELATSGWWKIHPALHRVSRERIPEVLRLIERLKPAGVMIHHFPWGHPLEHNTGLELVLEVAGAFAELPVLATHGGGYESWHLRAHSARLTNVFYDFSVTFAVYAGTDYLKPWTQYVERRRNRIVFGSDWPSADPEPQLATAVDLAAQVGVDASQLERHLLENSARLWPLIFPNGSP